MPHQVKFTFDDVLLVPGYSEIKSRKDVNLFQNLSGQEFNLPIITAPMDTVSGYEMANYITTKGAKACVHRNWTLDSALPYLIKVAENNAFAVGLNDDDRFNLLRNEFGVDLFCLDVAHGDQKQVLDKVEWMANHDVQVIAGNVVTPEATKRLRDAGAKFVRVGVGSGAACSTRLMTGFGYPQLSAIQECVEVRGVHIIADGGIRTPGDMVKALAFGADLVMVGRMLAGTAYTPGDVTYLDRNGNPSTPEKLFAKDSNGDYIYHEHCAMLKTYRGMASKEVNQDMYGGLGTHRAAEGESYTVPYKNETATEELFQNIEGGIRSGCTYAGASSLEELREKKQYVMVTSNTTLENKVHGKG